MTRIDTIGRGLLLSAFWLLLTACAGQAVRTAPPAPQFGPALQWPKDRFTVHTLPVGAGNCQIALCPAQNRLLVMDCGSSAPGSLGWDRPAIKQKIFDLVAPLQSKPELVITVSHSDSDHYNYLSGIFDQAMLGKFAAKRLALVGSDYDYNDDFLQWTKDAQQYGLSTSYLRERTSSQTPDPDFGCPPDSANRPVQARILAVNARGCGNESSLVMSMTYGGFRTIFTGDMTETTRKFIADKITDKTLLRPTQLITAAHHGASSDGSNSIEWIHMTGPQTAVISAGTLNWHPTCTTFQNYRGVVGEGKGKPHTVWCSQEKEWRSYNGLKKNIFSTEKNGRVSVSANANGDYDVDIGFPDNP